MKLFMNEIKDIGRDFRHLTLAICMHEEPIPVALIGILENCLEDRSYMETAKANLVAFASTEKSIKAGLENIVNSKEDAFADIKSLSEEILEKASSNYPQGPRL